MTEGRLIFVCVWNLSEKKKIKTVPCKTHGIGDKKGFRFLGWESFKHD